MAKAPKLKVYRTAIGFHDAYVAAPSQKAALAAWGSDHNLFGRGVAELVTDEKLGAEPLANPGTVIKRLRGTTAEQIAALAPDRPKGDARPVTRPAKGDAPRRQPKPAPKPDRAPLDAAETALAELEAAHAKQERELAKREQQLAIERRMMEADQAAARKTAQRKLDGAHQKYDAAIKAWRG